MSDLSRSLVDAAAEAICASVKDDLQMPHIDVRTWSAETWKSEGRAAVAAVLETLAANGAVLEDHEGDWQAALRGLAAEVKSEERSVVSKPGSPSAMALARAVLGEKEDADVQ